MAKEQKFTKKQLVDFGNYLLSSERADLYAERSETDKESNLLELSDRLDKVNDSDIRNFFGDEA